MADLHPDEQGFSDHLDQHPDDWDHRLVYSDWLEEQGRTPEAEAQRWMSQNKKHPKLWGTGGYWAWGFPDDFHNGSRPWRLPRELTDLDINQSLLNYRNTRREAESALAQVLQRQKQHG